jgi:hypothetical protein
MDWLSVNTEPLLRKRLLLWTHRALAVPEPPRTTAPRENGSGAWRRSASSDGYGEARPDQSPSQGIGKVGQRVEIGR